MLPKPPYKSKANRWVTDSIFYDRWQHMGEVNRNHDPVFTLSEDKKDFINFRKTFVNLGDPTGYKWAMEYLGDWNHWQVLMRKVWFREAVDAARAELYLKLRSEGVERVRSIANDPDSKSNLAAARYLAELESQLNKGGKGRPSKAEMDAQLKQATRLIEVEDEDAARIGLQVIQGGRSGN